MQTKCVNMVHGFQHKCPINPLTSKPIICIPSKMFIPVLPKISCACQLSFHHTFKLDEWEALGSAHFKLQIPFAIIWMHNMRHMCWKKASLQKWKSFNNIMVEKKRNDTWNIFYKCRYNGSEFAGIKKRKILYTLKKKKS